MVGSTDPKKADAGTIRGDLGSSTQYNIVHASDSVENAKKEIALWF
jgi:nucleoside-diphosphate kinase